MIAAPNEDSNTGSAGALSSVPVFAIVDEIPGSGRPAYFRTKRVADVVVSLLAAAFLLPLLPIIAVAIKLDSRGPVFFQQTRLRGRRVTTRDGCSWQIVPFSLCKFRTMHIDADVEAHRAYMTAYISGDEQHLSSLRAGRQPGDSFRPKHDPRITRVGVVLRKLSFDELPQLWNVIKGEMSLVGPRPPMPYEAALYDRRAFRRLAAPCGITGWAQVKGRCTVDFAEMVRLDLEYLAHQSVLRDLKILMLTVPVVLSGKGAG
jgi:lipopolysaccharide/colanic/teichoic acid biosynthesis glycosyltransferase